jgi:hypothetical protein
VVFPVIFPEKYRREKFYFDRVGPGKIFAATGIRLNNFPARTGSGQKKSGAIGAGGPGYFPVAGN